MKFILVPSLLFLGLGLYGCAGMGRPTQAQILNADYGVAPKSYKKHVTYLIKQNTLDPEKVLIDDWKGPYKGYIYGMNFSGYGYKVCATVNPMNEMGGRKGKRLYMFMIHNDNVSLLDGGYKPGLALDQRLNNKCNHLADINYVDNEMITYPSGAIEDGPRPL